MTRILRASSSAPLKIAKLMKVYYFVTGSQVIRRYSPVQTLGKRLKI